jgi:LysR family transcriptional regulator, benzoate and cis,cis-muconate-responsive activator of ben and cat genes
MFPHVSTEALVCALVLSEEGNLVRVGARLHTSHTNVGRKIRTLQQDWGVELFQRTPTGFELTEQGQSAIREIRESIKHIQRGFEHAVYTSVKNRKPLRVGHSLYVHERVLPLLQRHHPSGASDFPSIIVRADTTVHLKARVLRGELHVGFGVMPILDKDLWVTTIAQEYFAVCIPADHPFKDRVRLSVHDLLEEAIFWMPRPVHPGFYEQVTGYLFGVGIQPHNLHEARAIIQGIDLAAHKLGVALVPQSAARFQRPGVLFKPLTDRLIKIETAVFTHRDQVHGEVSDFVNSIITALRSPKTDLT